jgi:hypothetical protein
MGLHVRDKRNSSFVRGLLFLIKASEYQIYRVIAASRNYSTKIPNELPQFLHRCGVGSQHFITDRASCVATHSHKSETRS